MAAHTGTQFVTLAARYVGVPYKWGGSSPSGFDCSGLVYYCLGLLGISAPRTSQGQYAWTVGSGRSVSPKALQPGDLVFMQFPGEQGAGHVMIWLGNDKVLQAPSTGQKVQVSHFDPLNPGANEWGGTVLGYGRVPGLSYKGEPTGGQAGGGTSSPGGGGGGGGGILSGVPVIGGVVSGAEATSSFFGKLTDPHFWLRALEVIGGALFLMLGLYLITRQAGLGGVPEPPTPGLSDQAVAELARPPGEAAPRTRRKRVVRHEVSEAAERRAARQRRREASSYDPSTSEIPF